MEAPIAAAPAIPAGFEIEQPTAATPEPTQQPNLESPEIPAGFEVEGNKYGTGEQMFKTALEGAAQGVAGPLATLAETKLLGVKPEDIVARREENPWTHGITEAAGLISPVGEGALLAKAAGKVVPMLGIGSKIGSSAVKGAIEAGLFQGGDEISKAMLGQADPEAPVASALAHMGAAGLFGAGIGGVFGTGAAALKRLGDSKIGSKMNQMAEDFGSRWKYNKENPDLFNAVKNEVTDFHASTSAAADEVYGVNGLKQQAIERTVPEMSEAISQQNQAISDKLTNKMSEMLANPDAYPPRLAKKFQDMGNRWLEVATNPQAASKDVFAATQELKQELQSYAKFEKRVSPIDAGADFINTAKSLSHDLRVSLEDPAVWGKAAELQKNINKAFTDFLPAQKDFTSKFMSKVEGEHVIDPGKINTYVNNLGKPNAELKQQMMENYINAAEKYRSKIEDLHSAIGAESPFAPAALDATRGTFGGKQSPGAKLADYVFNNLPGQVGSTAATGVGTGLGAVLGGGGGAAAGAILSGKIAPYFSETLGRPISEHGANAILKALSSDAAKSTAHALDHAANVKSGAQKINRGIEAIFKAGGQQAIDAEVTDKQREKVKKYIKNNGLTQQLEAVGHPLQGLTPKKYAEGGLISAPEPIKHQEDEPQSQLSNVYPDHDAMLNIAKGRVFQYLSAQQPAAAPRLPFDPVTVNPAKERSYDDAIDLSIQPLGILNKIKDGTLTPENVGHMASMYPELKAHLDKQFMERITNHQLEDQKLPYNTRMSLSLFMMKPLDSTMTPAAIQAAQPIPKAPPQQGKAAKGSTSKLGKESKSYKTPSQEAESDRSARD